MTNRGQQRKSTAKWTVMGKIRRSHFPFSFEVILRKLWPGSRESMRNTAYPQYRLRLHHLETASMFPSSSRSWSDIFRHPFVDHGKSMTVLQSASSSMKSIPCPFAAIQVLARKGTEQPAKFVVGESLANVTRIFVAKQFHLKDPFHSSRNESFFSMVYDQLVARLKRITWFCIICSDALPSPGHLPTICTSDLCGYQYNKLRICAALATPRISPDVLSLLLLCADCANASLRRDNVFKPYPTVRDEFFAEVKEILLKAQAEGNVDSLTNALKCLGKHFPCPSRILSSPSAYRGFAEKNPALAEYVEWLASSNNSYLERVPQKMTATFLQTEYQFMIVSDTPEKQKEFESLVKDNGGKTRFVFHGSRIGNWHSIIRNGLKVMTGTEGQVNGHLYGSGIYTSPFLWKSLPCSGTHGFVSRSECRQNKCCLESGKKDGYHIVELIDRVEAYSMPDPQEFLVRNEKWCALRMLLLYPRATFNDYDSQQINGEAMCDLTEVSTDNRKQIEGILNVYRTADDLKKAKIVRK